MTAGHAHNGNVYAFHLSWLLTITCRSLCQSHYDSCYVFIICKFLKSVVCIVNMGFYCMIHVMHVDVEFCSLL